MMKQIAVLIVILILVAIQHSVQGGSPLDDGDMLKAAAVGDSEKVLNLIKNRGVSLTTRNNNGVR